MPPRVLFGLLLTLSLAACGGGGEAESPPAPTPAEESTPVQPGAAGPSFDPVSGAPSLLGASAGKTPATTVHMQPGELRFIDQTYPNGKKKSRRQVKRTAEGVVNHGPYVRWYKNGVVSEEGQYVEGVKHGVFVERFDTGQMKAETPYALGLVHGSRVLQAGEVDEQDGQPPELPQPAGLSGLQTV